jgi:hypothetical protein
MVVYGMRHANGKNMHNWLCIIMLHEMNRPLGSLRV